MQDYVNLMAQAKLRQGNYKFKVCLHQSEFKPSLCNLTRICKKKDIKKSGIQQRMHEPWVQSCTLKKEVIWLKQGDLATSWTDETGNVCVYVSHEHIC